MATTDTTKESLIDYRIATIEELGFSTEQATLLEAMNRTVYVKDRRYERKIDSHYLRKLIDAGATKEQVLAIVL